MAFHTTTLTGKVKVKPHQLCADVARVLLQQLQQRYEGKCSEHGFIRGGSVVLRKHGPGSVQSQSLDGAVVFDVSFAADVCNPAVNSIVQGTVANSNRFGLLAQCYPLEIIIAKRMVSVQHELDVESVVPGQTVWVQVMGKKYDVGDAKISLVGRLVHGLHCAAGDESTDGRSVNGDEDGNDAADEDEAGDDENDPEDEDGEDEAGDDADDDANVGVEEAEEEGVDECEDAEDGDDGDEEDDDGDDDDEGEGASDVFDD